MNSSNFIARNEVAFLFNAASLCAEVKKGSDGAWQVAPLMSSIPYTESWEKSLEQLQTSLSEEFPDLIRFGETRAKKAFIDTNDTITKPSYIKRISNDEFLGGSQLENLYSIIEKEPASGGLVFSVFLPEDVKKRFRPGYVPCLLTGCFLLDQGELHLSAFFRSQSIVEFGLFDLRFLRNLQREFLNEFKTRRPDFDHIRPGPINLQFSRVLIQRRLLRRQNGFLKRDEVLPRWLDIVEQQLYR